MTREQLDAIRARVDAATPGPWKVDGETCDEDGNPVPMPWGLEGPQGMLWSSGAGEYAHPDWPTATFIAKAREDVPALIAEIDRLNELCAVQNATMIDALCEKTDATHKESTAFARGVESMRMAVLAEYERWFMAKESAVTFVRSLRVLSVSEVTR